MPQGIADSVRLPPHFLSVLADDGQVECTLLQIPRPGIRFTFIFRVHDVLNNLPIAGIAVRPSLDVTQKMNGTGQCADGLCGSKDLPAIPPYEFEPATCLVELVIVLMGLQRSNRRIVPRFALKFEQMSESIQLIAPNPFC